MALSTAEQFFYDNAGFSYDPATQTAEEGKVETAKILAEAERALRAGPYFVEVRADDLPYDGDVPYDGPLFVLALWSVEDSVEADLLASIGGVAAESETSDYIRVVSAELAVDAGL